MKRFDRYGRKARLTRLALSALSAWPVWQGGLTLLLLAGIASAPAQAQRASLLLQAEATLAGRQWQLGQVAQVQADSAALQQQLQQLVLGRLPLPGNVAQLHRNQLEHTLRSTLALPGLQLEWQGAATLSLRAAQQTVAGERLREVAQQGLQQLLQQRKIDSQLSLLSLSQDVVLPVGQLEIRLRPLQQEALAKRMAVWLDLWVDGELYRSHSLLFELQTPPALADSAPPGGVLRGMIVPMQVVQGGVVVETRVRVQQDALAGQITRVTPLNHSAVLQARVQSGNLLVLEHENWKSR